MQDFGKLLLRLAVGGLMLFHGINKVSNFSETNKNLGGLLESHGLPAFLAYGIWLGELAAPALILVGLFTRLGGLAIAGTMVMAVYLAHQQDLVGPDGKFPVLQEMGGGWKLELQAFYFLGGLALAFLGSGKIAVASGDSD